MRSSRQLKLLRSVSRGNVSGGNTTSSNHYQSIRHNSFHRSVKTERRSQSKSKCPLILPTDSTKNCHKIETEKIVHIMDSSANSETRMKAFGICRDYLHGAWKQIDLRDLVLKRVSGGLSNWLYHCSLPMSLTPLNGEPTQVLLRFYGQVHGEDALESLITESVIFALLSERKLGPRLFGIFPGGRIEQYIEDGYTQPPSCIQVFVVGRIRYGSVLALGSGVLPLRLARPLLTKELRDNELSRLIAQKMAQIHGLNIPISKEACWLWGTMDRWMLNIMDNLPKVIPQDSREKEIIQRLVCYDLKNELQWLKKFLPRVGSPVVFSHNDLQEGNILIRPDYDTPDDKLVLIDFEYCSYNYRGFDLANHFCEWSYNYCLDSHPNFTYKPEDLPSQEKRQIFIRTYIETLKKEYEFNFAEADEDFLRDSSLFNEEHINKEVKAFTLASHFFWSLWAFVNAQVSKIPFGYWEYGICRLETYFDLRDQEQSLN